MSVTFYFQTIELRIEKIYFEKPQIYFAAHV